MLYHLKIFFEDTKWFFDSDFKSKEFQFSRFYHLAFMVEILTSHLRSRPSISKKVNFRSVNSRCSKAISASFWMIFKNDFTKLSKFEYTWSSQKIPKFPKVPEFNQPMIFVLLEIHGLLPSKETLTFKNEYWLNSGSWYFCGVITDKQTDVWF